jgi:hypothetical protein
LPRKRIMKNGWAFLAAITRAIEAWSDDVVRREPDAFVYRGADLRYAVERALFFKFANDAGLQHHFDCMASQEPPPPRPSDPWCGVIADYLSPDPAAIPEPSFRVPPLNWKKKIRRGLGNLARIGRKPYRAARLPNNVDVLFLTVHPKFTAFLRPVAEALGPVTAFLTLQVPLVESDLAEKSLPCIALRPGCSWPRGSVLRHFPELCDGFDRMAATFDALKPHLVVVPEGNAPAYELALRAGLPRGVATICLQHGAPAYTNPGFRNWNFADVLVWGQAFIAPYARYNPGQHFTVVGTPALLPSPRARAAGAAIRSAGFFLQKGATVIPAADWDALLGFMDRAAAAFPDIEIIVRDHPTQPSLNATERAIFEDRSNIRFMPPARYTLNEVLAACDVVVGAASTTLLEAIQSGAIPFIFGTSYPADFPDIAGAGAAIAAADGPTAEAALRQLAESEELRVRLRKAGDKLRPSLFAASGAEGAARIATALKAAASARPSV